MVRGSMPHYAIFAVVKTKGEEDIDELVEANIWSKDEAIAKAKIAGKKLKKECIVYRMKQEFVSGTENVNDASDFF